MNPAIRFISIVLPFLIAGCATTSDYEGKLNSWIGSDATRLVEAFGEPTRSYKAPSGRDIYEYEDRAESLMPRGPSAYCRTTFEVDSGKVVSWNWEGNTCH
jgi:hypothetical protein